MKQLIITLLLFVGSPAWATVPALDATPNIVTNHWDWLKWVYDRQQEFETAHPSARTTTYYVGGSAVGDDGNDGLSTSFPFATWDHAHGVAEASAGNVRIRLKRGIEFIEANDGLITKNNITVDSYGTGPRPKLSHFTRQYTNAANGWTQESGNQWRLSEANDIAWLRFKHDPYGHKRGYVLEEENSEANCLSNTYSFFYDATGDELFVNLGGENPNAWDLEAAISNADNGVRYEGDGCRVEDILTDGFGIHRTTEATDVAGIFMRVVSTESAYVKGCGSYFGPNHVMQANGSSIGTGGATMWVNCDTGYCHTFNSVPTDSSWVAFNGQGSQEAWLINSPFRFGALPNAAWDWETLKAGGIGSLCHTGAGYENTVDMCVVLNCDVCDTPNPLQRIGGASDAQVVSDGNRDNFTLYTGFYAYCDKPALSVGSHNCTMATTNYNIYYACNKNQHRNATNPSMGGGSEGHVWLINCNIYDDFTTVGASSTFHNWYNSAAGSPNNKIHLLNCQYRLDNITVTTDRFSMDNDARSNGADTSANSLMINSVYSSDATSKAYLSRTNAANRLFNNAFYQITDDAGNIRGYNLGTANIALSSEPVFGTEHAQLTEAGYTGNAAYDCSHDINGKPRMVSTPDVGPVDYSSTLLGQ